MLLNREKIELLECQSSFGENHIAETPIRLPCGFNMCNVCYKMNKFCKFCKTDHVVENETNNDIFMKMIKDNVKILMNDLKFKLQKDQIEIKNKGKEKLYGLNELYLTIYK